MTAFPKPVPRPKRGRKALRAKVWGVRRRARKQQAQLAFPRPTREIGTKHSRRPREWGFMAFCHDRGCELALDLALQRVIGISHRCDGPIQFAHLSDLKRYDVGDIGCGLCRDAAHQGIDGRVGGKAIWYVAIGREGQGMVRTRLASRARAAWDALPDAVRAIWDSIGRARLRTA